MLENTNLQHASIAPIPGQRHAESRLGQVVRYSLLGVPRHWVYMTIPKGEKTVSVLPGHAVWGVFCRGCLECTF